MLIPNENTKGPEVIVLSHFIKRLAENGSPDIMAGRPAMLYTTYVKGRVITFSPHPVYTRGLEKMIRDEVRRMGGK